MGSRIPTLVRSTGRAVGDLWRVGAVIAVLFVFSIRLGSKGIAELVRLGWLTALIGIVIVVPLVQFAFHPAWEKTSIGQNRPAPSPRVDRGTEQAAKSEDDAKEAASIEEWRRAVEEVLKEADAGQRAVAGGNAEHRDTLATAANTPQAQEPKPMDQQIKAQETEGAKAAGPIANDRGDSNTNASGPAVEAPQMNGPNEFSSVPLANPEAMPAGEGGETAGRKVRRGRHYGGGWHYRIHTTGVARMGPVLVFR